MNAIARNVGRTPAAQRERRQRIILVALIVVLGVLLAFELPKLLRGSSSSSSSTSSATTAAPAVTTPTAYPAATGVAAVPTVNVSAASVLRRERAIKRMPARDPFVPLASPTSGVAPTPAAPVVSPVKQATTTVAAANAAKPASTTAPKTAKPKTTPKTVTVAPKLVPTAAVIWTDGQRQVVGSQQLFKVGDTTFKLVSIGPKTATVSVPVGGIQGGKKEISLPRGKSVTLQDTVTGVKSTLLFTLPMSVVPTSASSNAK
jgi:hypothetical protein